jgi:hypothetical protein
MTETFTGTITPVTTEEPTTRLRFVVREDNGPGSRRILQQLFYIRQGDISRLEWRDVPVEVEE